MKNLENVVDVNPTQIENVVIENSTIENTVVEINLNVDFLDQPLKGLLVESSEKFNPEHQDVFKNTYLHIKSLKVKTPEMKIYVHQYDAEQNRLYNNRKSIESKSKKKAEEKGMSYQEYRDQVKHTGGGKTSERQFTEIEYEAVQYIFDPKLKIKETLDKLAKLYWLEVDAERKKVEACLASKKCNEKKKLLK